jgi:hypothetical protein
MKRAIFSALFLAVILVSAQAGELYGFGFTYGLDFLSQSDEFLTIPVETDSTHTGLGFNADVFIGQKLGFYAGGSFGILTGISRTERLGSIETYSTQDMLQLSTKLFGDALLGIGAFLPVSRSFDVSLAGGFGLTYLGLQPDGQASADSLLSLGPGASVSFGVPVSATVEIYASCRAVYGLILLGDYPANYVGNLSVTPAVGVRMKR